jgi:hypothetical protein
MNLTPLHASHAFLTVPRLDVIPCETEYVVVCIGVGILGMSHAGEHR